MLFKKKDIFKVLLLGMLVGVPGTSHVVDIEAKESTGGAKKMESSISSLGVADAFIYVKGYEWGPGVPKVILQMNQEISQIEEVECSIFTAGAERKITDIFLSTPKGAKAEGASSYLTIEMETTYKTSGSPFFLQVETMHNKWMETYEVIIDGKIKANDKEVSLAFQKDCISQRVCEDTELFAFRDTYSGKYENPHTKELEELTLQIAAYEPESLSGGEKNPLLIWLHGQGEGGTDADIAILGNEVTALAKEEIQKYFHAGSETGAYVLAVQTPTYWMDEGDGTNGEGSGISKYSEILMDAIQDYVNKREDIDTDRIYIGGCSNGGYMTMNMLIQNADYFAAAYPVCEAYSFYEREKSELTERRWFTDEKVEQIKNKPVWFTVSIDDTVVNPVNFVLPAYRELLLAGAENAWLSVFETVEGEDDVNASYMGHWSWIYLFNNQVTRVQNPETVKKSEDTKYFGTIPSNEGGGNQQAEMYENIFEWLNAQSN